MIPTRTRSLMDGLPFPRTRGDDPFLVAVTDDFADVSPHPRG